MPSILCENVNRFRRQILFQFPEIYLLSHFMASSGFACSRLIGPLWVYSVLILIHLLHLFQSHDITFIFA